MRKILASALKGTSGDDKLSSKRVIAFILVVMLVMLVLAATFFKVAVPEFVFEGIVDLTMVCLGMIGSEKFAQRFSINLNRAKGKKPDAVETGKTEDLG
jgi:hypothetical protein